MGSRILLTGLLLLWTAGLQSQSPPWEWVNGIVSNSNLSSNDVALEIPTDESVIVGNFTGNLSTYLGASGKESTDFSSVYGQADGLVARHDTAGNLIWAFKIGGPSNDNVRSVSIDPFGDIYITGEIGAGISHFSGTASLTPDSIINNTANTACFIAKYNGAGELLWLNSSLGSDGEVTGTAIAANGTAIFVAGNFTDNLTIGSQSYAVPASWGDAFLSKCDPNGNVLWIIGAGSPGYPDLINDLECDNDGVFVIGTFQGTSLNVYDITGGIKENLVNVAWGWEDAFVSAYDTEGNLKWAHGIGSNYIDAGNGIAIDASHVYVTGGISNNANFPGYAGNPVPAPNKIDIFLAALDRATGLTDWVIPLPSTTNTDDLGQDIAINYYEHLYMTGVFSGDIDVLGGDILTSEGGEDILLASFQKDGSYLWAKSAGGSGNEDIGYSVASGLSDRIYLTGTYTKTSVFDSITVTGTNNPNIFLGSLKSGFSPVEIPPANDNPCSAELLDVSDQCDTKVFHNIQSSDSGIPDPGCGNYAGADVWFKAVIPLSGNLMIRTGTQAPDAYPPGNGWIYQVNMALYSGTCGSLNLVNCYSNNSAYQYRSSAAYLYDLTPGDTVWVRIWDEFGDDNGEFTLCAFDPGHNPAWSQAALCAESAIIDLDSAISGTRSGFASQVIDFTGISDPAFATGMPDGNGTDLFEVGDWIKLDLLDTIPPGEVYELYFSSNNSATGVTYMTLWESVDDVTYYPYSFKPSTAKDEVDAYYLIAEHPARYLLLENNDPEGGGFTLDAVRYNFRGTRGGSWSGPGVTGSLFNPAGLSGPVSITYSAGGAVTRSDSTRAVEVLKSFAGNLSPDTTVCEGQVDLSLSLRGFEGDVIKWEFSEDGFLSSVSLPVTDSILPLSDLSQTVAFRVHVQNGSCIPDTSNEAFIEVIQGPFADPGPGGEFCGSSIALQAVPSSGTGTWSKTSGPGLATFNPAETDPAASANVDQYGTYAFTWTETNGICSDDSTILVTFYESPAADAGSGGDTCSRSFNLQAIPSLGMGRWSKTSGPGTVSFFPSDSVPDPVVSVSMAGSYDFSWTETNGPCFSQSSVTVNFTGPPSVDPGSGGEVCGLEFGLNATPSFGSGTWSKRTGPGMAGFTPSESAPDATLSVTEAGTYEIVWTETDGTCSNDSVIVVSFWALPESEAGADLQICEGSDQVSISGSTSAGGSIAWTSSGGGSFDAADSDNPVYILGADANVITLYKAVTSPFTCGTAMDSMQIFIQQTPVANAGRDGETCGYVYQLSAIPDIGAGNWTTLTGPGTATFSPSPDQPDAMVTVDLPGSYEFIWTEINGPCIDRDTVAVRFIGDLMTDAGPGGSTCGLQFDLRASIPELSTLAADLAGKWSMISGPGQARFSPSDSSAAATAIVDELGEYVFQWEITVGNCTGSDTVAVGFFNQPVANAGPDQVLEFTFNTNLNADIPGVGTGTWSLVKGAGMIESAHDPGTRVSGLGLGQNEFQWTISSEFCPDVSDQVLIVVNDILAPTVITPNGDGQNDFLEFRGIEELSGCELFILDRWGSEVYQSNDYKNNWGGIDQKGRELSPDTYYYILTIPPDRVIKKTLKIIR